MEPAPTKDTKNPEVSLDAEDEFEEFEVEDWDQKEEDTQKQGLWEQDWDDDNLEDDFSQRLKNELAQRQ